MYLFQKLNLADLTCASFCFVFILCQLINKSHINNKNLNGYIYIFSQKCNLMEKILKCLSKQAMTCVNTVLCLEYFFLIWGGNSWHTERRSPLCPGRDGFISKRNTEGYVAFRVHNPKELTSSSQLTPDIRLCLHCNVNT